jgi:hypothetical protein
MDLVVAQELSAPSEKPRRGRLLRRSTLRLRPRSPHGSRRHRRSSTGNPGRRSRRRRVRTSGRTTLSRWTAFLSR